MSVLSSDSLGQAKLKDDISFAGPRALYIYMLFILNISP